MPKGPLFVQYCAKDFLDGVQFLTPWEELAYRRICDLIYSTGDRVADDDKKLATMTKTGARWRKIKAALIAGGKLFLTDDGTITNARCQKEIAKIQRFFSQKKREKTRAFTSDKPLENNETQKPYARAKTVNLKGEAKESESRSKPSESVAAREGSKSERGLGVASLPSEPAAAPEPEPAASAADPPTPEHVAYVDAAVERASAALRGDVPKAIRDPAAYQAAVKDAKFTNLVKAVNNWVGTGLDGDARMSAWEVLAEAERVGAPSGMVPAARKNFDQIVAMYRASSAAMEAAA